MLNETPNILEHDHEVLIHTVVKRLLSRDRIL